MMENKRGMSAVVTTLIIILLVIVALGIIWVVVKNVIQGGVEQVDLSTKCREVEIQATRLVNTTSPDDGTDYNLTLTRTGTGDEIGGIKVVLANIATNTYSDPLEFGNPLAPLETATESLNLTDSPVIGADKIQMTVWFLSDLGEEQICPTTVTKEF